MKKDTTIAALLAAHREAKGWSQEALAATANVSARTVQRLERGETQDPITIERVGKALGIARAQLETTVLMMKALPTMIRVPRMRHGDALARLVQHSHAFLPQFLSDDPHVRETSNALAAVCDDWNGIVDDANALLTAASSLGSQIAEIEAAGAKLYATVMEFDSGYKDPSGKPIMFDTLLLAVREQDFMMSFTDGSGEYTLISTQETIAAIGEHSVQ